MQKPLKAGIITNLTSATFKTKQMESFAAFKLDFALFPGDGVFNMGPAEAAECARLIGAKHNILIHLKPCESVRDIGEKWDAPNKLIVAAGEEIQL